MPNNEPPEKVKVLLVKHLSMFLGVLLMSFMAALLVGLKWIGVIVKNYHGEVIVAVAMITLATYFLSRVVYKKQIKAIRESAEPLENQLDQLLKANTGRWLILQIGCVVCIIAFLLTAEFKLFILVWSLLIPFWLMRPTAINIATDLDVREDEILKL